MLTTHWAFSNSDWIVNSTKVWRWIDQLCKCARWVGCLWILRWLQSWDDLWHDQMVSIETIFVYFNFVFQKDKHHHHWHHSKGKLSFTDWLRLIMCDCVSNWWMVVSNNTNNTKVYFYQTYWPLDFPGLSPIHSIRQEVTTLWFS